MTTDFEKSVHVQPAYDKRSDDPGKNFGIGSCRILFVLKGPLGAVQFLIGTNWFVPSAREHLDNFPPHPFDFQRKPEGWDVGYHSPKPMYEDQKPQSEHCDILGGRCYYDGSGLMADGWIEDFVAGGTKWLWPKMEEVYHDQFEATP